MRSTEIRRHRARRGAALWAARMLALLLAACAGVQMAGMAPAQEIAAAKKIVRTQDDLPRFTYPLAGTATELLTADDAVFAAFADKVGADIDGVLANYEIEDRATLRSLLAVKTKIDMLRRRDEAALQALLQMRELEDKPDARLLSGLIWEVQIRAGVEAGATTGSAYEQAYRRLYAAALDPLPWAVVGTWLKETRASRQMVSRNFLLGEAQAVLEPAVAAARELSGSLAWELIDLRFWLVRNLPVKDITVDVLGKLIAANTVEKPDIWAAREVTLTQADRTAPVVVAIWDTGVDLSLFPGRVHTDPQPVAGADPHGIAFDLHNRPTSGLLFPLTSEQAADYPAMRSDFKGRSDMRLAIDSPEADGFRTKLASLRPDEVAAWLEKLTLFRWYVHGTHVAGIAARGNPAIRLAAVRRTWDWKNVPDPPTEDMARNLAAAIRASVDWFRRNGVRVVNMSWGETPDEYEWLLEKSGAGGSVEARKALARRLFLIERDALHDAIQGAPDILFICAAGNANADSGFDEAVPSSLKLPNLLTVGAVDQAGDEAGFTSYGETVRAHANGHEVESYFPGGALVRVSGTSMASPNAANLAAKLLALAPGLAPAEVIDLIVSGATPSEDGRRNNIHPQRSVELLRERQARGRGAGP